MAISARRYTTTDCPNCKTRDAKMRRHEGATVGLTCQNCRKTWAAPTLEIAQEHTPDSEYR